MSGGYLSCGAWSGDDKSGSAFFDMVRDIEDSLTDAERDEWEEHFAAPLQQQMDQQPEDDVPSFTLSPRMMDVLGPKVAPYFDRLRERLGNPPPDSWHQIGEWRSGDGWRLLCAQDVLEAYEISRRSSEDVFLHFD
jgi:hypothetical protein